MSDRPASTDPTGAPAGQSADRDVLSVSEAAGALALAVTAVLVLGPAAAGLGLGGVALVQVAAFAVVPLVVAARTGRPLHRLGVRRPRPRHLAGAALIGASFWLLLWLLVAPIVVTLLGGDAELRDLERVVLDIDAHPLWVLATLALIPAVCEELLHRGGVARALRPALGYPGAVVISALLFGAAHGSWLRLVPTALLGLILAHATLASRSIIPAILIHFLNNSAALLLALGHVGEPSPTLRGALIGGGALVTTFGLYLMRPDPPAEDSR